MAAYNLLPSKDHCQVATATDVSNHREDPQKTPRTLKEWAPSRFWRVGVSILLITIPVAYIILVAMVAYLNNKEQSPLGDDVLKLLQIASTLWPISFAAVAGPCLKTLALHRAEQGSSIASLKFLLTSQTTVAAFKNIFTVRHITVWSIGIAFVWCLSPLGGQAAVRSLHLQLISTVTEVPALYYLGSNISDLNLNLSIDRSVFSGDSAQNSLIPKFQSAIITSFYMPDTITSHANGSTDGFDSAIATLGGKSQAARLGRRDLWRNVRIPFMELLPDYNPDDPSSWVPVPTDMVVPYASLIGLPIRGGPFSRVGNSTLTVRTRYQTLSCQRKSNATDCFRDDSRKLLYNNASYSELPLERYRGRGRGREASPNFILDIVNNTGTHEHLARLQYPDVDFEPVSKLELVVAGRCEGDEPWIVDWTLQICDISTSYVEIQVECTRLSPSDDLICEAAEIRHTPGFPISGNLTALSSWKTSTGIVWELPFITASENLNEPSGLETYLYDPTYVFRRTPDKFRHSPGCFSDVSLDVFGSRMATILNTAIMATYNFSVLTGGDGISLKDRGRMWHNTTATWTEFVKSRYVMHKAWFSVSLTSTLVLFCLSLVNVVVRCIIKAPDFLEGVAGLTRDSQYIRAPQEGSGMSGSDRLQMIKGTKVRICDVNPDADVGKIALTTNVDSSKLDCRRAYS
ncbi:hypothetical protein NCS52_00166400 [Fusarium sp. LHS14.1]|nr:hypothetical protein NCS52_00166400 [Fusarium sp. LHS14.1]